MRYLRRWRLVGLLVLGAVVAVYGVAILQQGPVDYSRSVYARAAAIPDGSSFKLAKVTDFGWDQAFIFPTYTDSDVIDREVGQRVNAAHENLLLLQVDQGLVDDGCLLVFLKHHQLVRVARVPTSVNFSGVTSNPAQGFVQSSLFVKRNSWIYPST